MTLGAVGTLPSEELPTLAMNLEPPVWLVSSEILHDNGTMVRITCQPHVTSISLRMLIMQEGSKSKHEGHMILSDQLRPRRPQHRQCCWRVAFLKCKRKERERKRLGSGIVYLRTVRNTGVLRCYFTPVFCVCLWCSFGLSGPLSSYCQSYQLKRG